MTKNGFLCRTVVLLLAFVCSVSLFPAQVQAQTQNFKRVTIKQSEIQPKLEKAFNQIDAFRMLDSWATPISNSAFDFISFDDMMSKRKANGQLTVMIIYKNNCPNCGGLFGGLLNQKNIKDNNVDLVIINGISQMKSPGVTDQERNKQNAQSSIDYLKKYGLENTTSLDPNKTDVSIFYNGYFALGALDAMVSDAVGQSTSVVPLVAVFKGTGASTEIVAVATAPPSAAQLNAVIGELTAQNPPPTSGEEPKPEEPKPEQKELRFTVNADKKSAHANIGEKQMSKIFVLAAIKNNTLIDCRILDYEHPSADLSVAQEGASFRLFQMTDAYADVTEINATTNNS